MKHLPVFTLAVLITAGGLQAQEPVKAERPLSATGTVEIQLLSGSIHLIGSNEAKVEVSGGVRGGADQLQIEGDEDRVIINVEPGGEFTDTFPEAHLEIRLPSKSRVLLEIVSGSIKAEGLAGRVSLESVNGSIYIQGIPREAEISTVSGSITLEGDGFMEEGTVETVSGNIDVRMGIHPRARLDFETVSGSIDLRIPKDSAAKFEAETFSGKIENELGPEPESTDSFLPSQELSFTLGDGGAHVSLSSFSGSIRIRGI